MYFEQQQYNEFASSDIGFRMISLARIVILALLSLFLQDKVLIYIIIAFTLIITFYKSNKIIYFFPYAEWASSLGLVWSWVSAIKFLLRVEGYSFYALNISIIPIAYFYFVPSSRLLGALQWRIHRILNEMRETGNNQFQVYLSVYYASITLRQMNCPLTKYWNPRFKFQIETLILQKPPIKSSEYTSMNSLNSAQKQNSPRTNKILEEGERNPLKILQEFIYKKPFIYKNNNYSLENMMFFCYFLVEVDIQRYISILQIYYTAVYNWKVFGNELIKNQCLQILFKLICQKNKAHKYTGSYIKELIKYQNFDHYLQQYSVNERRFLALTMEKVIDVKQFRAYLDQKMYLRDVMKKQLDLLQFVFPSDSTLKVKYYIYERFVENNQILSKQNFMYKVLKEKTTKSSIFNFSHSATDDTKVVFLCDFMNSKGLITHYNKNFQTKFETTQDLTLKVSDIIPDFWQNDHDDKISELQQLYKNYEHDKLSTYYACIPNTNTYVQVTCLQVLPYCELKNQVLLVAEMIVDTSKNIKITPVEEMINKSSKLTTRRHVTLLQDRNQNVFNETEQTVQCFGKKYLVKSLQQYQNFQTTNLIEPNPSVLNDNFQVFIKLGLEDTNRKILTLQKAKKVVHIFIKQKRYFLVLLWILFICFLATLLILCQNFRNDNTVIKSAMITEIKTRNTIIQTFNFESVLMTVSQNFPFNSQRRIPEIFAQDALTLIDSYHSYYSTIQKLIIHEETRNIVMRNYQIGNTQTNVIVYTVNFGVYLSAANTFLVNGEHSFWMIKHLQQIIKQIQQIQKQSYFIVNTMINKLNEMLLDKIQIFYTLFVICLVMMTINYFLIVSSIFYICQVITKSIKKPLILTQSQRNSFKDNYKQLIQQNNFSQSMGKYSNQDKINITQNKSIIMTLEMQSTSLDLYNETKQFKGKFYNVYPIYCISAAVFITVFATSYSIFKMSKSQTQKQLLAFKRYADLNADLFMMFDQLMTVILDKDLTQGERNLHLRNIQETQMRIASANLVGALQDMYFDKSQINTALFENPCEFSNSKICQILDRSMNPYPTELNFFLSTFFKLVSYVLANPGIDKEDPQLTTYVQSSYISLRSLGEINTNIFKQNEDALYLNISRQSKYIALVYIVAFVLAGFMIEQSTRAMHKARIYGSQILSILPSGAATVSKSIEYEVNSIVYRNNFGKQLDYM